MTLLPERMPRPPVPFALLVALAGVAACASPPPAVVAIPVQPPGAASASRPVATSVAKPSAPIATATAPIIKLLSTSMPTCGLDTDGNEWTWSRAHFVRTEATVPNAVTYACAGTHSCATTSDGNGYCWGNGGYGKLGTGTEDYQAKPALVRGIGDLAEIGVHNERTCARTRAGAVYCWGDSEFGKAGDGRLPDNVGREKLLPGKPILTGAVSLGVGSTHACSVLSSGRLSCWGQNHYGSVGQPVSTQYVPRPAVVPRTADLAHVIAASAVTCTIDVRGKVACFGASPEIATGAARLLEPAVEIAIGWASHACARLASGTVMCWGHGEYGVLGDGTENDRAGPVEVKGLRAAGRALRIAADGQTACALLESGAVQCWGKEMIVRGPFDTSDALSPVLITPEPPG